MLEKQPPIYRILDFVRRRSLAVIIVCLLITALFGAALINIQVDPDLESLLPDNEEITELMSRHGGENVDQNYFVFAVEAPDPFTLNGLNALSRVIEKLERLPEIKTGITPFNLITFTKNGTRLGVQPMSNDGKAPATAEDLERFRKNIDQTPFAENLVISKDRTTLVSFFPADNTDNYTELMNRIEGILSDLDPYYRTYTTGTLPFMKTTESYLSKDLSRLLLLAVLVILVTFYLGFRAKRAVLLPLLIVLMGTLWCLGFMSLVGFPLSMISVVIPPLVLALGSSYSIHILNQYYREGPSSGAGKQWITSSIAHVNKTILLAAVTTISGLLSLLAVSMRQTREFALSTSFGILACAVLSLFFFPAMLYRLKEPKEKQSKQVLEGPLAKAMTKLGVFALRARYFIAAFLLITAVVFVFALREIRYNTAAMSYFPKKAQVVRDMRFFTEKIGGFEEISITLSAPENRKNYFLNTEVLAQVSRFENSLAEIPDICYISSFLQYLKYLNQIMYGSYEIPSSRAPVLLLSRYFKLIASEEQNMVGFFANDDFSKLTVTVRIYDSAKLAFIDEIGLKKVLARIDDIQSREIPSEIKAERWGPILRYLSLSNILQRDSVKSMLIAVLAILCITAIAFRSIPFGLYALVPLVTGIMLNVIFMVLVKIPLDMITIMVSSVAIGVGVDDSIHFLIQFRRQIASGKRDIDTAIGNTLAITGRPIVLTTFSILAGLLILSFAMFKPIVYFGWLVAFTLAAVCIGTIIVLPAILSLGRRRVALKETGK